MDIKQETEKLLDNCINIVSPYEEFKTLSNDLKKFKSRLSSPIALAVVGAIKAGKSTLMNALLGENLVTGTTEATYRPVWFKYAEKKSLKINFKDDIKSPIVAPIDDLYFWTDRKAGKNNPDIENVAFITFYTNNLILKNIEFIDTPGLKSSHESDSNSSYKLTGIGMNNIDELDKLTKEEASNADAILYAFSKSMHEKDQEFIKAFNDDLTSDSTPLNTLAAFTKFDHHWPQENNPAQAVQEKIINKLKTYDPIKKNINDILPISAVIAQNLNEFDENDFNILKKLNELEFNELKDILETGEEAFLEEEDINLTNEEKVRILKKFGLYGIYLAVNLVNEGKNIDDIKDFLIEKSGIAGLYKKIKQHFGNRSFYIKLQSIVNRIEKSVNDLTRDIEKSENKESLQKILEFVHAQTEELKVKNHIFKELRLLEDYYQNIVKLDEDEAEDLLAITGKYGTHCEAKLSVNKNQYKCPECFNSFTCNSCNNKLNIIQNYTVNELKEIAKEKFYKWNRKENGFCLDTKYQYAASIIARSYEILFYHLSHLAGTN